LDWIGEVAVQGSVLAWTTISKVKATSTSGVSSEPYVVPGTYGMPRNVSLVREGKVVWFDPMQGGDVVRPNGRLLEADLPP
jgi:hypothetical protein